MYLKKDSAIPALPDSAGDLCQKPAYGSVKAMLSVTFIDHEGESQTVKVREGCSVMEAARNGGVAGINAECGGLCACATCHVYVDSAWTEAVGPAGQDETDMLEFSAGLKENSRLSCQIKMNALLDGLVVHTPVSQH